MRRWPQIDDPSASCPLRARVLAFISLITLLAMSVTQAGHTHASWASAQRDGMIAAAALDVPSSPGESDAACPVCIAMHSALPRCVESAVSLMLFVSGDLLQRADRVLARTVPFALFSRPPPARRSIGEPSHDRAE